MTMKTAQLAIGLIAAASPLLTSAAAAQSGSAQSDYERGYQAGRADAARANQGYGEAPPSQDYRDQDRDNKDEAPPPTDYDATRPPPPPPDYQPDPVYAPNGAADQRYEAYAEDWAARNCVKSSGNTATGAVIGGLFGALLGSSIAGRDDRGAGALMGGIAGAAGGAAVGSAQDNATSPGCPPGYVVRSGAPAFYYDGWNADYYYAAPAWYRPWVFAEGRWTYRPYPYHTWYYRHYGWDRPGWHGGRYGYRRRW